MEKGLALNAAMIKKAVATPNLKMVLGTDAVAGAHGHNADEIVERVRQGNQKPMDAIVSATSMAARSLGLDKTDRHAGGRLRSRPDRARRRPADRHHRGHTGRVRHEGRKSLQAISARKRSRRASISVTPTSRACTSAITCLSGAIVFR